MRRILGGVAAAVLALTAVPALANEIEPVEPELNAACEVAEGVGVVTVDGFTGDIETPAPPLGETTRTLVLDLAGLPVGTTGDADVVMSWGIPTNDFDLNVNGTDSFNLQPVDAPEESVSVPRVRHCGVLSVTATNFVAPVVLDTLTLDVSVRTRQPV